VYAKKKIRTQRSGKLSLLVDDDREREKEREREREIERNRPLQTFSFSLFLFSFIFNGIVNTFPPFPLQYALYVSYAKNTEKKRGKRALLLRSFHVVCKGV
jgi:hypothetical protein